jgi:hypothetical protein
MKLNLALTLLLAASHATAAPANATQCKAGETTYFNCSVKQGSKVASLCGKGDGSAGSYLQYRYGSPGKAPEQTYPASQRDLAMGEKFFFDSQGTRDGPRADTGVWFEYDNTFYALKYSAELSSTGHTTTSVSEILQWNGVPSGAPHPTVCKLARAGENLSSASNLIEAMSPQGRMWKMSPLDLHYQPKPQPQPKAD